FTLTTAAIILFVSTLPLLFLGKYRIGHGIDPVADGVADSEVVECPNWAQGCMDAFPESVAQLVLEKIDAA
ncbi:MAG: hypothetical protein AAFV54_01405, partial [Pseudomonadota bacterium]